MRLLRSYDNKSLTIVQLGLLYIQRVLLGNRDDINGFLHEAKKLVSEGRYDFVPRRKNMQSLARYGLTIIDAKSEILGI